jgi:hypothetical protein
VSEFLEDQEEGGPMLMSGQRMLTALEERFLPGEHATRPVRGTGPGGGPNGTRWITGNDVLVENALRISTNRQTPKEWVIKKNDDFISNDDVDGATRVTFRDYQQRALIHSNPENSLTRCVFVSGAIEMGCGLG